MEQREPGTGQWFLNSSIFKSWAYGDVKTLWCPGIRQFSFLLKQEDYADILKPVPARPCSRKYARMIIELNLTERSSIIVDNLRTRFGSDLGIGIASIYCNYKEQDEQTLGNILAGIWRQLVHNKTALSDDVKALYKKQIEKDTRPTVEAIDKVLSEEVARYRAVYVIVDALDECPEARRVKLLEKLQKMQSSRSGLHLLATSRIYDSIARHFKGEPRLEIMANTEDVRAYVKGRITKGSRLERHVLKDPVLASDIENAIAAKSENMYDNFSMYVRKRVLSAAGFF